MSETWPAPGVPYDPDAVGPDATARWQAGFDEGIRLRALHWERDGRDIFRLVGACPRCGHRLDLTVDFDWIWSLDGAPHRVPARVNAVCNCTADHAPRPDGERGCGWSRLLDVTFAVPGDADGSGR